MKKLILATHNREKVREIRAILAGLPLEMEGIDERPELPEIAEDGITLEENALKKASEIFRITGLPALADDTGLEVFRLGMKPGVISARYAGEHVTYDENNRKLLDKLHGVTGTLRRARFRCVAVLVGEHLEHLTEGICYGRIIDEPRGKEGFGYDPLFVPDGLSRTFAELSQEEKNRISHRAKAFGRMRLFLEKNLASF